jgi:hypothetical protein
VSGVFSFWQEYRAEQTLAGLMGLLPPRADVLRDGKTVELPVEPRIVTSPVSNAITSTICSPGSSLVLPCPRP